MKGKERKGNEKNRMEKEKERKGKGRKGNEGKGKGGCSTYHPLSSLGGVLDPITPYFAPFGTLCHPASLVPT